MMIQWHWRINASVLRAARRVVVTTLASLLLASVGSRADAPLPIKVRAQQVNPPRGEDTSVRIAAESAPGDPADRRFGVFRRSSE
jgi:hypothetical protein